MISKFDHCNETWFSFKEKYEGEKTKFLFTKWVAEVGSFAPKGVGIVSCSIFPLILAWRDKLKDVKINSPHFLFLLFSSLQLICHNTLQGTASKEIITWQGSPEETMGLTGLPSLSLQKKGYPPLITLENAKQKELKWMDGLTGYTINYH